MWVRQEAPPTPAHGTTARSASPFLESSEAVPDDEHLGKGVYRPVTPQKVVVQGCAAVGHVEDGGLAADAPASFLRGRQAQ